jgi:hypothetical protein
MKKTFCMLLAVVSFSALADQLDQRISERLNRLQEASYKGDIARLSQNEKKQISDSLANVISLIRLDDRRPEPRPEPRDGDWRRQPGYARNSIVAYTDDSCRVSLTEVKSNDDCRRLSTIFGTQRVWSVSLNGECINTTDSTFAQSCEELRTAASAQKVRTADLVTYTDDSCRVKLTDLDSGIDCKAISPLFRNQKVWSVSLLGKCVNVTDETFSEDLCMRYQDSVVAQYESDGSRRRGDTVELYTDDSCANELTSVKRGDNCEALNNVFNNQKVWSVKFRGQCVNIPDSTFLPACQDYSR